ncbi:unnamed protein product [Gulo gulo]|uniref:Uncharacterized protein n=1 Tax=Gulo gulo TaxID=48420 RepID=A0A9X9QAB2_GULGU|nr:unnamed protein product [Gulo gulo]
MKAGDLFREWPRDTQDAKSDQSWDCLGRSGVWSCTSLSGHLGSLPRKAPSRALSLQSVQQGAFLPLLSKERLLLSPPPRSWGHCLLSPFQLLWDSHSLHTSLPPPPPISINI